MTKKNEISVPEGYFEKLEQSLSRIPRQEVRPTVMQKVSPWLAYAASLAILATLGNFIFRQSSAASAWEDDSWDYISYLSRSLDPDGMIELKETEQLAQEDIVNYLMASNISVEQLEQTNYEEHY